MTIIKPIIAIVGRPNVGKSTLFNRLTKSRDALVVDQPGVTRDRQYGVAHYGARHFLVIDTGGIGGGDQVTGELGALMRKQAMLAVNEAAVLIWLVDGRVGLTSVDSALADTLRKLDKPIFVAVNKVEGHVPELVVGDFFSLGMESIFPISARRGDGIEALLREISNLVADSLFCKDGDDEGTTISVLGRPNVGKSTLVNRMVGEERMLTFSEPGTTRDSIRIPFKKNGRSYVLIDTAGVRRKSRIQDQLEKFSVVKSFEAIRLAKIVILVIDGGEGVTEQDTRLLGMIADSGKPLIIAVNKWDCMEIDTGKRVRAQIARRLRFIDYARYHYISALRGSGIGDLFKSIDAIEKFRKTVLSTSDMTAILQEAVITHPPQMVHGRRIRLRYAHLGGVDPLRIIVHGNQIARIPASYKRYLAGVFRKKLKLVGATVLIEFRQGDNPYKDRKNILTPKQKNQRKRLAQYVKRH